MSVDSRTGNSPLRVAGAAYVCMVAGMIATPLFARGGDERAVLAVLVVASLFATAVSAAAHVHGVRALVAAAMIVVVTFGLEVLGSSTGIPFGAYEYTDTLRPQLFDVPIIVSFAWAGITLTVHGALSTLRIGGKRLATAPLVAVMAAAITAWDTFLDPQMVAEGYWVWQPTDVSYRGIPLVNYAGWLLTAGITSAIALVVCRSRAGHGDAQRDGQRRNQLATALPSVVYATLAVLSTIGFVVFFDDLIVALVGGISMGAFVAVSMWVTRQDS